MEKKQNLLTIKAFAEASGRSQQTIYKQIGTRLAPYVHEIDGQKYIEHQALKEVFGINVEQPFQPKDNNSFNRNDDPDHPLYAILRDELEAKNRQIEQLQVELAEERKHSRELTDRVAVLAEQAQALHAGTIKTQLPAGDSEEELAVAIDAELNPEPEQRRSWWKKIFG